MHAQASSESAELPLRLASATAAEQPGSVIAVPHSASVVRTGTAAPADVANLRIPVQRDELGPTSTMDDLYAIRERSVDEHRERKYRFPAWRAAIALIFLVGGFALCISGMALPSLAMGIVGALLFIPGAYVTFVYLQILRRVPAYLRDQDRWMDVIEDDPY